MILRLIIIKGGIMNDIQKNLTSLIKKDEIKTQLNLVYPIQTPQTLAYENSGDRGVFYKVYGIYTSECTQCPMPMCCFASYGPGSILHGHCITQEIQDLVTYH